MRIEIGCEAGTIRLSDSRTSLNAETELDDILAGMVHALMAVTGQEPVKVGDALSSFGFSVPEVGIEGDESEVCE